VNVPVSPVGPSWVSHSPSRGRLVAAHRKLLEATVARVASRNRDGSTSSLGADAGVAQSSGACAARKPSEEPRKLRPAVVKLPLTRSPPRASSPCCSCPLSRGDYYAPPAQRYAKNLNGTSADTQAGELSGGVLI
jgi:hypothetical protein